MPKCILCGIFGIFLSVDKNGYCESCARTTQAKPIFVPDEDEIEFIMNGFSKGFLDKVTATLVYSWIFSFERYHDNFLLYKSIDPLIISLYEKYGVGAVMRFGYIMGTLQQRGVITDVDVKNYKLRVFVLIDFFVHDFSP